MLELIEILQLLGPVFILAGALGYMLNRSEQNPRRANQFGVAGCVGIVLVSGCLIYRAVTPGALPLTVQYEELREAKPPPILKEDHLLSSPCSLELDPTCKSA